MQINITTKEGPFAKILKKFTLIFFGIFLTSSIFAISTKVLGEYGLWVGALICAGLIFCGFYYIEKGTRLRLITWTMLITIIFSIILFFIGLGFISSNLDFQPTP
jgi:4-amino-4-deoxy-L-arabinose transferase-like glycosyltransferase